VGAQRTLVETPAPEVAHRAPAGPGALLPLATAEVLSLQRTAGNQATIRALAGRPTLAPDRNFDKVAGAAGVKESAAPVSIELPDNLTQEGREAWKDSFPKGRSREQGGIVVQRKDGGYTFKRGKPGKSGSFDVNYDDQSPGERIVAVLHTHPYDKTEGGYQQVSFSGADLSSLVFSPERMEIVNAGSAEFVAVRTKEFDAMVKRRSEDQKVKLAENMDKLFDRTFKRFKGRFQQKVHAACIAVCRKYHLAYYAGKTGGKLKRQGYVARPRASKAELDTALQAIGATQTGDAPAQADAVPEGAGEGGGEDEDEAVASAPPAPGEGEAPA
jgi:hypothetical protein